MAFINGLSDAYGEYKSRLENAQAKGVNLHHVDVTNITKLNDVILRQMAI